jgi:hypothetical protein
VRMKVAIHAGYETLRTRALRDPWLSWPRRAAVAVDFAGSQVPS